VERDVVVERDVAVEKDVVVERDVAVERAVVMERDVVVERDVERKYFHLYILDLRDRFYGSVVRLGCAVRLHGIFYPFSCRGGLSH